VSGCAAPLAKTAQRSVQPVASPAPSVSGVSNLDRNRRLDNFEDYEQVLHRVSEVEAFLTQVSASASI
jgi:hypothetical protein